MINQKRWAVWAACSVMLLAMIFDSKTALYGCREGISVCLQTVIPTLFPFLLLTSLWIRYWNISENRKLLLWSVFVLGFLGGYPTGAKNVQNCVTSGRISSEEGKRILPFCSNAGPAFIFGLGSQIFPSLTLCWLTWGIHIMSALILALMSGKVEPTPLSARKNTITSQLPWMQNAIMTMGYICGWVVLFRMILVFLQRWILWILPQSIYVLICGLIELTNGSLLLDQLGNNGLKLVIFSVILNFGGICVWMQTLSVVKGLDMKYYLPGKIVQACISLMLCFLVMRSLPMEDRYPIPVLYQIFAAFIIFFWLIYHRKQKFSVAIQRQMMYNGTNSINEVSYAIFQKNR